MNEVITWIKAEGEGHWFFVAFPVALLCLFLWLKGRRLRFLVPGLLLSVAILNPVFYKKWTDLDLYAYWRILWVVPVIPTVAALIPSIAEKTTKPWAKAAIAAAGTALIILGGTFLYKGPGGNFSKAANAAKLPEAAVQAADRLLELEDRPRAVFQYPVGTYLRQYTGEIDQLYGRNIDGYILGADSEARNVHNQLTEGNLEAVAAAMANDGYEYLVADLSGREEALTAAGFEQLGTAAGYGIYRANGKPILRKERNELGQVLSVTTVDGNGDPINGDAGYATVSYAYDDNGNIIREFRTDAEGFGVADSNGRAGWEREYDEKGHVLMERTIGSDGNAVNNSFGYAEIRRTYRGSDMTSENYFNAEGIKTNRIDTFYASVEAEYDNQHHRIREQFYDSNGDPVSSNYGYAQIVRRYDGKYLTAESYYDSDGNPAVIFKGYSAFYRTLDSNGRILTESYTDAAGEPINCVNGYASVSNEYDNNGNITKQSFMDEAGSLVTTPFGYAEVHRVFEGKRLILEEYYGADGKPYVQSAGYAAIRQNWNGDTLVSREYLDAFGKLINRTDGYAKVLWEPSDTCTNVLFYDSEDIAVSLEGLNLVKDVKYDADGWSEWLIPGYNTVNSCQNIGYVNLGPKAEGDVYTSTIEIEFRNVSATEGQVLSFWTQGAQDGKWTTGNVWNSNLVSLNEAPLDGIYTFSSTVAISGDMVDISTFNVGFRCDYWGSGMYRVRNVMIEKGDNGSEWKSGL